MNEMIQQATELVEASRKQYFKKIGKNLANPNNGSKTYYSLINKLLNKVKAPTIPPLIEMVLLCKIFLQKLKYSMRTLYSNVQLLMPAYQLILMISNSLFCCKI